MGIIARSVEAITMVLDVMRGYLAVAGGLTDISLQRARNAAELLLSRGTEAADRSQEQIQELAEDLMKQSQTNRDLLIGLIRTEVDRTVGRMGFVREEELAAVRNHVLRLEAQLKALQTGAAGAGTAAARTLSGAAGAMASKVAPPRRGEEPASQAPHAPEPAADSPAAAAPVTAAKRAPARTTAAKKAPANKTAAKKAPANKTAAKKAPAKKAPAKKAPAKKTAAKKTAAAVPEPTPEPAPASEQPAQPSSSDE